MKRRVADIVGLIAAITTMSDETLVLSKPEKFAINGAASTGVQKLKRKKVGNHFSYYVEKKRLK